MIDSKSPDPLESIIVRLNELQEYTLILAARVDRLEELLDQTIIYLGAY
jgi:hypothetical protein